MLPVSFTDRWIANPADKLNVVLALAAPWLLLAPYFVPQIPLLYVQLYGICLFLFIGKANYILHLHIHRPFAWVRFLNIAVELALGLTTSMVASNWRIQHLYGHHRGVDAPYRGDRSWQLEKYTPARAISYPLLSMGPTLFWPYVESFKKGVRGRVTQPMSYRWAFIEQTLLLLVVAALAFWNPWLTLFYLLPWYFCTHFVTHYVDYLNHYGCLDDHDDLYRCANNSVSASFNASTHNFGYHTAHHMRPSAHWTELPDLHGRIADKIPDTLLKPVSWSGLLLPYHMYLSRQNRM